MSKLTTRVGYLVNASHNRFDGYDAGDLLVYAGDVVIEAPEMPPFPGDPIERDRDLSVCEVAFGMLNRDDRPFGQTAPSMSVGDVVCLSGGDQLGHRYYTVARMGFKVLDTPPIEFVPASGMSCVDVLRGNR